MDVKKHIDTITIVSSIIISMLWMNGKFNELEKEVSVVKTILIMKNIMPPELAKQEKK